MNNYNKQTIVAIFFGLFITLFLHDVNLYPKLSYFNTLMLSSLRFFLLITPLIIGFLIVKFKKIFYIRIILLVIWIIFLPYTIYSITEIRHVAELCRLPFEGEYYTEICYIDLWTLFPTFIYAAFGSLGFVFSVSQVCSNLFSVSWKKQYMIIILCILCGTASVFGIYSRVNIWDFFSNPLFIMQSIIATFAELGFIFNSLIFSLFTIGYFFVINRIFRQVNKYII